MSALESYTLTDPFGNEGECAKFTIDAAAEFMLPTIMTLDQEYTFSMWLKSDDAGEVTVEGSVCSSSTSWQRFTHTFTATLTDLIFNFTTVGTYYIYHPQLEIGNVATDWTPAPEDVEQDITDANNETREVITEQTTSVLATAQEFTIIALESYIDQGEFEEYKESVNTEFSVQAGQISMNFETVTEQIDEVEGELQSEVASRQKHITFSENGIIISAGENTMSIRIDNDIVVFEKGGEQFGWWDGVDFYTGNVMIETTKRAQFGNFAFVPRSDGSLSFLKVDHKTGFYASLVGGIMRIYNAYPTLENTTMIISDISAELSDTTLVLGGA